MNDFQNNPEKECQISLKILTDNEIDQRHNLTPRKIEKIALNSVKTKIEPLSFRLQNRRFLGNKYKLLNFIENIVKDRCGNFTSFCDIFAGTGVVGNRFNNIDRQIISNDFLFSNYYPLIAFLGATKLNLTNLKYKINLLNNLKAEQDNYFSINYGNTYFTVNNARKIGAIREKIEDIACSNEEKIALITALIYATDKVANTVGHYDAYRSILDTIRSIQLLLPDIAFDKNINNKIFRENANSLIRKITCDVLYIDPPYNSRQYSDTYHLLENLARWEKPAVAGKAKKMERSHLKSEYCLKSAPQAFADLISNANCKHILVSYNNTEESKHGRSNAKISYDQIISTLQERGAVEVFESDYKAFTTGKSATNGHRERLFYCKVTK